MVTIPSPSPAVVELRRRSAELKDLRGIGAVLGWDEQTMMPPGGASQRARQLATLATIEHERLVDPALGAALDAAAREQLSGDDAALAHELRRSFERANRLPRALVRELAEARSAGLHAWIAARSDGEGGFARFAPALRRVFDLTLRSADLLMPGVHPYDALLDEYEPGMTVARLRPLFARLQDALPSVLAGARTTQEPPLFAGRTFALAAQEALSREVLAALGFDATRGRLDHSEHPFSTGIGSGDVRITTHLEEAGLWRGLFGTIHECGHAMYEQSWSDAHQDTVLGDAPSFGLHESQSRFWENVVGRSRPFCSWLAGRIEAFFPDVGSVDPDALFRTLNRPERSLIRVTSDEATYNLHIAVRFELEVAVLEGTLAIEDLPRAWNDHYERALGIRPASDQEGVLQDVHWSAGAIGYFPSYTLGNLWAASYAAVLPREVPGCWDAVARGQFGDILGWMRSRIHHRGRTADATRIVEDAVGKRDHVEDLITHLRERVSQ